MKKILLMIMMAAVPAVGKIGETVEQCEKRYGAISYKENANKYSFVKNGLKTGCHFEKGKCVLITHISIDILFSKERLRKFDKSLTMKLLEVHGQNWKLEKKDPYAQDEWQGIYISGDGAKIAEVSIYTISVGDSEYVSRYNKKTEVEALIETIDSMK